MTRTHLPLLVALAGLLLGAGPGATKQKKREDPSFWGELARPGHKRFVAALARGQKLFEGAGRIRVRQLWRKTMEDALAAFDEAIKASPKEPQGHFWRAKTLYELDRMKQCIGAFLRVRRLDPQFPKDYTVSFSLGIAYSKLGRFAEAVQQYDRAERWLAQRSNNSSTTRSSRATLHGNAAESLMAIGRLDEAIQRYREALALHPSYVLAWWGLAVALDRDEQVSKAIAAVNRALTRDTNMGRLKGPGVFFIPRGDIHYYYGLGYLAQGKTGKARASFETFVKELPNSGWAARAREHLAQLGKGRRAPIKRRKRLAPFPHGGTTVGSDSTARDRSSIRYRINSRVSRIRACYTKELRARKDLGGQLRVSFEVGVSGKVKRARLVTSTMRRPSLHACVLNVIRATKFNKLTGKRSVKIIYPFEFKPK